MWKEFIVLINNGDVVLLKFNNFWFKNLVIKNILLITYSHATIISENFNNSTESYAKTSQLLIY